MAPSSSATFYRSLSLSQINGIRCRSFGRRGSLRSFSNFLCYSMNRSSGADEEDEMRRGYNIFNVAITMTVLSSSLPHSSIAAKLPENKKSTRNPEFVSPEYLRQWSSDLPLVSDRISYTEILDMRKKGKLKHVIKLSCSSLKHNPEVVLVILEDFRAFRAVLPSISNDSKFWESWDELQINEVCVNAYSPPVKKPEIPNSYLGFLSKFVDFVYYFGIEKPLSKKEEGLRKKKEEVRRAKEDKLKTARSEKDALLKKRKDERRMKMREVNRDIRRRSLEVGVQETKMGSLHTPNVWNDLASNSAVTTALGILFFYLFYRVVVLNYRKQKKDYDDRVKIEKAEAEERRLMRESERKWIGQDEDGDEPNAHTRMATEFMKSGARVRPRRRKGSRPPQYMDRAVDVKFSDVAGLGKIRLELEEIVNFFTHGETYRRRGLKIPGGILLCGPPGVGKTLLAKAVAGEAGVNFFSISASQFVEIYVGVGASRVRSLYQEAKDNAPSVVFIDELDAVGRERGIIKGSGGQERDATLNQLLVSLDGFEGRGNVITIASTNRPDILDPALVRPGRFDRKIVIPKPGIIGRIEILQVHAKKKPMAEDVDYMAVANITDGMVGAELANILEVAAINMMRDGRTKITTDDLLQAAQIEERGMLDKMERSPEMWKQVALNEAAMAVVASNFPDLRDIEFLTIAPRAGRELGYVRFKISHLKFEEKMFTRQTLLDYITVQLAPRAADEVWNGQDRMSTIWAESADNARSAARVYVTSGLSENHHGFCNFVVEENIDELDTEACSILEGCYTNAKEILRRNRELTGVVVDRLVESKSLGKEDFLHLVDLYGNLDTVPPSILDVTPMSSPLPSNAIL